MRRTIRLGANVFVAVIVAVAALAVLWAVLGLPMGLVYVETESMSPTLEAGDGVILIPTAVTGSPEPGDVIVFDAQELNGGGPTTHRIVEETERGYITQGDNNNAPDQVTDEPPVAQAQIAGQALEIGGRVVTIPYTGTIAATIGGVVDDARQRVNVLLWRLTDTSGLSATQFSYVLTGVLLVLYGIESFREGSGSRRIDRRHVRAGGRGEAPVSAHAILLLLTAVLVVATAAAMVVPGGAQQYDVVASESESPVLVPPGEETTITHGIANSPVLPMTVFVEGAEGVRVDRHEVGLDRGGTANVSATFDVPDSIGHHRFYVVERRYIAVFPESVTRALYTQHPWLPVLGIDALVAVPYYLVGRRFLPARPSRRGQPRRRT
ncbi:MAG: signal peptidase I, archaeal type [halophilic archaeon J07HX5]|nr:MAG: signal peptidase I, archaeal type [halophilic archaeon J07HX5]